MDSKSEAKPLTERERKNRSRVSEDIYKASHDNRHEEVSSLRKTLEEAAEIGVISKDDLIQAALPSRPENPKEDENKEEPAEVSKTEEKIPQK